MPSNIEILNNITTPLYEERIPQSTRTNLADLADSILNYTPLKNEVLTEIINKIAFTIIRSTEYDSIFSDFRGEDILYGDTIEEIQITVPEGYDPRTVSQDPFSKVQPNVKACYHTINSEIQYKQTITDVEFRKAVKSANGLDSLVNGIIASMTDAMKIDDDMKNLAVLSNTGVYGQLVYLGDETGTATTDSKTLITAIKNVSSAMSFATNKFNFLRVLKQCPKSRQILIIKSKYKDMIDLDFLAGVYNLSKADITQRIIEVPDFIGLDNVPCMIIDERALSYHKSLQDGGMIYNPQGVPYTNHYLNSWGCFTFSLFMDAVMFVWGNTADITLEVTSNSTPVLNYVVKDSDGRIVDLKNDVAPMSAGTYTVYAEGYVAQTFTVSAQNVTSGSATIEVTLTAQG